MSRSPSPTDYPLYSSEIQRERAKQTSLDLPKTQQSKRHKMTFTQAFLKTSPDDLYRKRMHTNRTPVTGISNVTPELLETNFDTEGTFEEQPMNPEIALSLHPKVLEQWINSILTDAETYDIPGVIQQPITRLPLYRYHIDRVQLRLQNLNDANISRLYSSLFVYSIGYYQVINDIIKNSTSKPELLTSIWKVYTILLQITCHVDFDLIFNKFSIEKEDEKNSLKLSYEALISNQRQEMQHINTNLVNVKRNLQQTRDQLEQESIKRQQLQTELQMRGNGYEDEINMRIIFEGKLNRLYAQHRGLETRIKQAMALDKIQAKALQEKDAEIATYVQQKIKLKSQIRELEQKCKALADSESKVSTYSIIIDKKLEQAYKQIGQLQQEKVVVKNQNDIMVNEQAQVQIEINALQMANISLKETIERMQIEVKALAKEKDYSMGRVEELDRIIEEEYVKYKHYEQEYEKVRVSEIHNIGEAHRLRLQLSKVEGELDDNKEEIEVLKANISSDQLKIEELSSLFKSASEKVEVITKVRRELEEKNQNLKYENKVLQQEIREIRKQLLESRAQHTQLKDQAIEFEKELSSHHIKLASEQKQAQGQREAMDLRISAMKDQVYQEQVNRDKWVHKYQVEQQKCDNLQKQIYDLEAKILELESDKVELKTEIQQHIQEVKDAQLQQYQILSELHGCKSYERELMRKIEFLQSFLGEADQKYQKLEESIQLRKAKLRAKLKTEHQVQQMTYEDLRMFCNMQYLSLNSANQQIAKLESDLENANDKIQKLKTEISNTQLNLEQAQMKNEDFLHILSQVTPKLDHYKTLSHDLKTELSQKTTQLNTTIKKIPKEYSHLDQPFKPLFTKIKELQKLVNHYQRKEALRAEISTQTPTTSFTTQETQTDPIESSQNTHRTITSNGQVSRSSESYDSKFKMDRIKRMNTSMGNKAAGSVTPGREIITREAIKPRGTRLISFELAHDAEPNMLKSIYKHEERPQTSMLHDQAFPFLSYSRRLQAESPDIRRYIRQANARRKKDYSFMQNY